MCKVPVLELKLCFCKVNCVWPWHAPPSERGTDPRILPTSSIGHGRSTLHLNLRYTFLTGWGAAVRDHHHLGTAKLPSHLHLCAKRETPNPNAGPTGNKREKHSTPDTQSGERPLRAALPRNLTSEGRLGPAAGGKPCRHGCRAVWTARRGAWTRQWPPAPPAAALRWRPPPKPPSGGAAPPPF